MSIQFCFKQFSLAWVHFSSIWPIDRALSGANTPSQSGPENDGNEGVLGILQSSSTTGSLLSDWLVPYIGHSYPNAKKQSTAATAWTTNLAVSEEMTIFIITTIQANNTFELNLLLLINLLKRIKGVLCYCVFITCTTFVVFLNKGETNSQFTSHVPGHPTRIIFGLIVIQRKVSMTLCWRYSLIVLIVFVQELSTV